MSLHFSDKGFSGSLPKSDLPALSAAAAAAAEADRQATKGWLWDQAAAMFAAGDRDGLAVLAASTCPDMGGDEALYEECRKALLALGARPGRGGGWTW